MSRLSRCTLVVLLGALTLAPAAQAGAPPSIALTGGRDHKGTSCGLKQSLTDTLAGGSVRAVARGGRPGRRAVFLVDRCSSGNWRLLRTVHATQHAATLTLASPGSYRIFASVAHVHSKYAYLRISPIALNGRLVEPDGSPDPQATIAAFDPSKETVTNAAVELGTLGLICLVPSSGVCQSSPELTPAADGSYAFGDDQVPAAPKLLLDASSTADPDAKMPVDTTLALVKHDDPQPLPNLALWTTPLALTHEGSGLRIAWGDASAFSPFSAIKYSLFRDKGDDDVNEKPIATGLTDTSLVIPDWVFEDTPYRVVVKAAADGSDSAGNPASVSYRGLPTTVSPGPTPLSRGVGCLADDANGLLQPSVAPCPLTDGDLDDHKEVDLPGECSPNMSPPCGSTAPTHKKLCVDLGTARSVGLVVVRTPFGVNGVQVQTSLNGTVFTSAGSPKSDPIAPDDTYPDVISPPQMARMVCVVNPDFNFSGAIFSELSAWTS